MYLSKGTATSPGTCISDSTVASATPTTPTIMLPPVHVLTLSLSLRARPIKMQQKDPPHVAVVRGNAAFLDEHNAVRSV